MDEQSQSEKDANPEALQDEYPVAPLPPEVTKRPPLLVPPKPPRDLCPEPREKERLQYTLADMFALTAAVAVFFSILSLLRALTPNTIAGTTGLGAFISLILLAFWPPEQPLIRLGWWVLFVLYLLACIAALIFGR